MMVVMMISEI